MGLAERGWMRDAGLGEGVGDGGENGGNDGGERGLKVSGGNKKMGKGAVSGRKMGNGCAEVGVDVEGRNSLENLPLPIEHVQEDQDAETQPTTPSTSDDELADEWAKELEAEISLSPNSIDETEDLGRELEAEMEITPEGEEESEEE